MTLAIKLLQIGCSNEKVGQVIVNTFFKPISFQWSFSLFKVRKGKNLYAQLK